MGDVLRAELAAPTSDALGESAVWSPDDRRVYWIDGYAPSLHGLDPATGALQTWELPFPAPVGMVARESGGGFAIAHAAGVSSWSPGGGAVALAHPEHARDAVRYNDGKADRAGRLWLGSYDLEAAEPRGVLWRFGDAGGADLADAGFAVFNGPAFSPDGRTAYVSDSMARRILAYDVRDDPPFLAARRVFAAMTEAEGLPDGLTTDAGGDVWCAMWGGARVVRFAPTGERTGLVEVPAPQVTSVAFGGEGLFTLFVTTARCDLGDAALAAAPLSGALFAARTGARGLEEAPARLRPAAR